MSRRLRRVAALMVGFVLLVAACGGGSDSGSGDTSASSSTVAAPESSIAPATTVGGSDTTVAAPATGAISSVEDAKSGVIRIVAKGSFAEPAGTLAGYTETTGVFSGSGFIIDPSGIAVTNNHVVTGAATLEVFVGGSDESVNARVLGVSECFDLAVLQLEGDGYPFFEFRDGAVDPGLKVFAAGFPLGDPEYTLLDGIVAKAKADGDTNWASVDSVIEHTASIQPGNSGGPLIDESGQVVGINYAGGDVGGTGTSQFFAIGGDLALPTVEKLKDGDFLSLGVNGQAVVDPSIGLAGVFVSSVDTNSPAGTLGLQPGDVIEAIEGLPLGTDGTMKDYCDVLQSHAPTDKLKVEVLRFGDNLRLTGEFNGLPLTPIQSIVEQLPGDGDATQQVAAGDAYTDFVTITDDLGLLEINVPVEWNSVLTVPYTNDAGDPIGPEIIASPDIGSFQGTWGTPGVDFIASDPDPATSLNDWIDLAAGVMGTGDCQFVGDDAYDDGVYTGRISLWESCGGTDAQVVIIAAEPADGSYVALVAAQLLTQADYGAMDEIIRSFRVTL